MAPALVLDANDPERVGDELGVGREFGCWPRGEAEGE
jgi:hypothetical protein